MVGSEILELFIEVIIEKSEQNEKPIGSSKFKPSEVDIKPDHPTCKLPGMSFLK